MGGEQLVVLHHLRRDLSNAVGYFGQHLDLFVSDRLSDYGGDLLEVLGEVEGLHFDHQSLQITIFSLELRCELLVLVYFAYALRDNVFLNCVNH